jgi:hypothetical protein
MPGIRASPGAADQRDRKVLKARQATTVASGQATLATKRRTLLLIWARLPPAGSRQLFLAHFLETGFGASCGSSDFNMITEISDAVGESGRGFGRITASEVFGAEILVASTIPQPPSQSAPRRQEGSDRGCRVDPDNHLPHAIGLRLLQLLLGNGRRSRLGPDCVLGHVAAFCALRSLPHASPIVALPSAACAAARRAMGTRKGEHET